MTRLPLWRWPSKAPLNSRNVLPGLSGTFTTNVFLVTFVELARRLQITQVLTFEKSLFLSYLCCMILPEEPPPID